MATTNYSKIINSIEESIEYENHNQILLRIENRYLIKNDSKLSGSNSYGYHRKCPQNLTRAPFLHWRILKCSGCGVLPPDEMAGVYSLHNMEYIQQGVYDADA